MRGNLLWRPKKAPPRPLKKADWNRKKSRKTACFSASKEGMGKSFLTSSKKADRKGRKSSKIVCFPASKEGMEKSFLTSSKKADWNRKKSRKTACLSASKEGMGKSFLTSSKKADRKEGKSRRATNFSASKEEMLPRAFFYCASFKKVNRAERGKKKSLFLCNKEKGCSAEQKAIFIRKGRLRSRLFSAAKKAPV